MKEASQAQTQLQAIAVIKKKRRLGDFALYGGRQGLRALDLRKLLKKLDQNFHQADEAC